MRGRIALASGAVVVGLLGLAGCRSDERQPAVGEAFVGASTLTLRADLIARAKVTANVKYGDRLQILSRRRRFYKVRTANGSEGWIDGRQLLTKDGMDALNALAVRAGQAPSQGSASVLETLNVHTVPYRQAPSFLQVKPGSHLDVLAWHRYPRVPYPSPQFIQAKPVAPPPPKKKKKEPAIPPPPPGPPPELPPDWQALSEPRVADLPDDDDEPAAKPPVPVVTPTDEWALVRTADGKAGWVLGRMLLMSIPDEVAQYAERARISAYFAVGSVAVAEGEPKSRWLWATLSSGSASSGVDFDSIRLFTFNTKRKRYETAFIDRTIKGWLPIRLRPGPSGTWSGFTFLSQEKDGSIVLRDYSLVGDRVRLAGKSPGQMPEPWFTMPSPVPSAR